MERPGRHGRLRRVAAGQAATVAEDLVVIGFFEERLSDYWVPFMYRPALEMVQGSAEWVIAADDDSVADADAPFRRLERTDLTMGPSVG